MRSIVFTSLVLVLALAACGGGQKAADAPENADDTASSGSEGGAETPVTSAGSTPSSGKPVPGDDSARKPSPCGGADIPDLASVLTQAACEVPNPNPNEQKNLKDLLEIKVVTDTARIAPGSTATVTVIFKNRSKADLPLNFVVDPEPRFDFEVYTLKGSRADAPKGAAPSLPPEVANAQQPESKVARVTLAQQGTAKLSLKWNAVKYKWASKDRAKGALPGRGYPRDPAGPLSRGKYVLRVLTPLTNVFEGGDHEVSQPRIEIDVASMP